MTTTTGRVLTVDLPLPPRACHSNARVHWTERATANSALRQWAAYRAREAMGDDPPRWRTARITVQARYPDRRRRDNDGLLASLKAAIDSLVDVGILVDDDRVTYEVLPATVDRDNPGVQITIQEVT